MATHYRELAGRIFNRKNGIILVGAIVVAVLIGAVSEAHDVSNWIRVSFEQLVGYNHAVAGIVFVLLAAVSAALSFFTSTPLVPVAVALWGKSAAVMMLFGGWLLGAIFAYWVGRFFAGFIQRSRLSTRVNAYREQLGGMSEFGLMLLFRFAAPAELASYTLGLLQYHFGYFLLATIIAEFPFAILAIYSSTALIGPHPMLFVALMMFGVITMSIFVYLFHHRLELLRNRGTKAEV